MEDFKEIRESVEKLKRLNGLRTDDINVNQLLKIRKSESTLLVIV